MDFPQFGTTTIVVNGTIKEIETRSVACNTDDLMYSIPQRYAVNYPPYFYNMLNMYPYPFILGNPCPCQKIYTWPTFVPQYPPEYRVCDYCTQNQQCYNPPNYTPQMIYYNGQEKMNPSRHSSLFSHGADQSTSRKSSVEIDEALKSKVNIDKTEDTGWQNKKELNTSGSSKKINFNQNSNDDILLNKLDEQFNAFIAKNNYYDVIQKLDIESLPPDEILKLESQFLEIDNLLKSRINPESDEYALKSSMSNSNHKLDIDSYNQNSTEDDIETNNVKNSCESKTTEILVNNTQQTILNELLKPSPRKNFDDEDIINSIYENGDCSFISSLTQTESEKIDVSSSTSNMSLDKKTVQSKLPSHANKVSEVPMMIMIDTLVKEQPKSDSKLTQLLNHIEKETRLCQNSCSSQNMTPERLKQRTSRDPDSRTSYLKRSSLSENRFKR